MITFITLNIYNVLSSLNFRLCAVKQSLHSVLVVLRCLWVAFLSYSSVTQEWTSRKNTGCPVIALNVFAVGEQSQAVGAATKWLPTVCACNTFNLCSNCTSCLVKGNLFSSDCSRSQKDWQRFAKWFVTANRCVINRLHEIAKLILLSHKLIADF